MEGSLGGEDPHKFLCHEGFVHYVDGAGGVSLDGIEGVDPVGIFDDFAVAIHGGLDERLDLGVGKELDDTNTTSRGRGGSCCVDTLRTAGNDNEAIVLTFLIMLFLEMID